MYVRVEQLRCWGLASEDVGWSVSVPQALKIDLRTIGDRRLDTGQFKLRAGPFVIAIGVECVGGGCYCLSVGDDRLMVGGNRPHGSYFMYDESVVKITDGNTEPAPCHEVGPDGGPGSYRACFELCW